MKTATLLLLISALWGVELRAATVSFSNIPATNVVKATDLLLLDSALGGTNYSTRTLTVSNLANVVAAPVGTVVASGTPASTNTFFAPSDLTGTNAVPRAILAADIATSIVTGKQTNATLFSLGGVTTNAPAIAAGSIAAFSSSNVLGAATSAQLQSALGNVYQATNSVLTQTSTNSYTGTGTMPLSSVTDAKAPIASPTFTGTATAPIAAISELFFGASQVSRGTLSMIGTNVIVDFSLTNRYASCTLTGTVANIIATNAAAGKWYSVRFRMPSSNVTPTFPFVPSGSITNWFGGAPSTMTANTVGDMLFVSQDSTTNSTLALYVETQ